MIKDDQADEAIKKFVRLQSDIEIDKYSDVGANGELYFGKRQILNDRVALKFYYYNANVSSHQEPLLLKEVKHENILEIYDAKIIDNQYAYFLTPEISGGDLQRYIERNVISTKNAITIIQGILKGLAELHKEPNNFVHRDLKPNNILIDKISLKPFIGDFGSIKKIPDSKNSVVASKNTFIYKPYEAVIDNVYCKQSDIYQIGIVLFQLLNGHFPKIFADWLNEKQRIKLSKVKGSFEQWEYIEECINRKIVGGTLLDYKSLPQYIDDKLIRIIKTATQIDLSKRFSNCAEFLKALFDYSKNAKNWWFEDDIIYVIDKKQTISKIYKSKKGYEIESKKHKGNWRKDNNHKGTLKDIMENLQ